MIRTPVCAAITLLLTSAPCGAADPQLAATHLWTFAHTDANGSSAQGSEIVAYDDEHHRLWVVGTDANQANIGRGGIDILDLNGKLVHGIGTQALGGINSVAVANGKAAVAITAPLKTDPGLVRFYDAADYAVLATIKVGANPDAVTFTRDGRRFLVANEGEPSSYLIGPEGDPAGSVSIIDALTYQVRGVGFENYNARSAALKAAGVRLTGPNASVAQDLEPEYIAVSADGKTAFVTLQEANSVAIIDIARAKVTAIRSMGLKDHGIAGNGLDASDRDGPGNIKTWNIKGLYMPDGIAGFTHRGKQYYVTANEGDSRADWPGGDDEDRIGELADSAIDGALNAALGDAYGADWKTNSSLLSRLNVSSVSGDRDGDGDLDELQAFGARSFSILDDRGKLVFDSGDRVEQIIKASYPEFWAEDRSDNKGPEPESAVMGKIGGRDILFVGLERAHAVMAWDLTDLSAIRFLTMIFTSGDSGPEGLKYFTDDGKHYLAVANEVSATTSLYRLDLQPGRPNR